MGCLFPSTRVTEGISRWFHNSRFCAINCYGCSTSRSECYCRASPQPLLPKNLPPPQLTCCRPASAPLCSAQSFASKRRVIRTRRAPNVLDIGPSLADAGPNLPEGEAEPVPNLAELGRIRPASAQIGTMPGRTWPRLVDVGLQSADFGQAQVKMYKSRPPIGPLLLGCGPILADVGPSDFDPPACPAPRGACASRKTNLGRCGSKSVNTCSNSAAFDRTLPTFHQIRPGFA